MSKINVYLTFNGNCEEAFNFYRKVFNGKIRMLNRFKEMPANPDFPVAESLADKVMHVTLQIDEGTLLMGSDSGIPETLEVGNNFSLSVTPETVEEADKLFADLGEGGKVTMPLDKTFWGAYFGTLQDRFGINWMINCTLQEA